MSHHLLNNPITLEYLDEEKLEWYEHSNPETEGDALEAAARLHRLGYTIRLTIPKDADVST
jgi:hypothetical protein